MDDKYTRLSEHITYCVGSRRHVMPPRIDVSRQDIAGVVRKFYQRVRTDDILGPIFATHVHDWLAHEEKITCFWANAILFERDYFGNPMQIHINAGNVQPDHFAAWLALFDETLALEIPAPQCEQWSALAHRIGRGLSFGVSDAQCPMGAVPKITNFA